MAEAHRRVAELVQEEALDVVPEVVERRPLASGEDPEHVGEIEQDVARDGIREQIVVGGGAEPTAPTNSKPEPETGMKAPMRTSGVIAAGVGTACAWVSPPPAVARLVDRSKRRDRGAGRGLLGRGCKEANVGGDGPNDRRKALEEEFFARQNQKLKHKLKAEREREEARKALREAYPHLSAEIVDRFLEHGMDIEAIAALGLVPLAMVAWADGSMSAKEREAILSAAEKRGFAVGTKAHDLLVDWLSRPPSPQVIENWKQFVESASEELTVDQRLELRNGVLRLAEEVARAAGGFLGFGSKISKEEQAMLDEVSRLLR